MTAPKSNMIPIRINTLPNLSIGGISMSRPSVFPLANKNIPKVITIMEMNSVGDKDNILSSAPF